MKKTIILLLMVFTLISCGKQNYQELPCGCKVIVIDECEYIGCHNGFYGYGLAHKGNCKYCKARHEVEQNNFLEELKKIKN